MQYLFLLCLLLFASPSRAAGEPAGQFDYYVLSLGWTPSWCAQTGDARSDPQCEPGQGFGFTLHGLWPQDQVGWPSDCPSTRRPPSRGDTRAMADIMGSAGLAWHEWKKHGVCSGLSAQDYFALARRAYDSIRIPAYFNALPRSVTIATPVIEAAFIEANPALGRDMITVTCAGPRIAEVRICLTRDLQPRDCAPDTVMDCRLPEPRMEPVR